MKWVFFAAAVSLVAVVSVDCFRDGQDIDYRIYTGMVIDSRCVYIGWFSSGNPEGCIAECRTNIQCNALNVMINGTGCVLRACPYPIPKPYQNNKEYDAYTFDKEYGIYPGMMLDGRCTQFNESSLPNQEDCVSECRKNTKCNAVHYIIPSKDCAFYGCPFPISGLYIKRRLRVAYILDKGYGIYPRKEIDTNRCVRKWYASENPGNCIAECRASVKCNAISYKTNDGGCYLEGCPEPDTVPYVSVQRYDDVYTIKKGYGIYPNKIIDWRCIGIGWYNSENPEGCIEECKAKAKCNAFSYRINGDGCYLKACPFPIPEPYQDDEEYDAYTLNKDMTAPPTPSCPPTAPYLTWSRVGDDRFVFFDEKMSWPDARALCQSHNLDLYHPRDLKAVALYLSYTFDLPDLANHVWLGGKGNGTHQVWLSGNGITQDDLWYPIQEGHYAHFMGEDKCLFAVTIPRHAEGGWILGSSDCKRSKYGTICG